jgi:hypothetical protein
MNTVKDFTLNQRVATDLGDGTVTKIGRVYVYVEIDGTDKIEKMTPAELRELAPADEIPVVEDAPIVVTVDEAHELLGGMAKGKVNIITDLAGQLDNSAPVGGRPPMRIKGNRASADNRRKARKTQRQSRRANRTR